MLLILLPARPGGGEARGTTTEALFLQLESNVLLLVPDVDMVLMREHSARRGR